MNNVLEMFGSTKRICAGIVSLSSLVYCSCSSMPVRTANPVQLEKEKPVAYSKTDEEYSENIKKIDSKLKKHNDPKKVDLGILVDMSFIEKYGKNEDLWWTTFSSAMDFVDGRFNQEFGIDFDIDSVQYIKLPDYCPKDVGFIVTHMRLHSNPGEFDAFILLSGESYYGGQGTARRLGNHAVIAPDSYSYFLVRIIQHELSHFFNAEDVRSSDTIMSNSLFNFSYNWSKDEKKILNEHKDRVWSHDFEIEKIKKVIATFSTEEERFTAEKLVCYALSSQFYKEGLELAEEMLGRYPDNKLIDEANGRILKLKKKKEKEEKEKEEGAKKKELKFID